MENVKTHKIGNDCIFCSALTKMKIEKRYKSVIAIKDQNPVTKDHLLILPLRHVEDYFLLTNEEKFHADTLIHICKKAITERDPSVTGFNIGINCGESAGQTIFHCHIHLIPRRDGDTPSPRGGVRGVIPEKMNYPVLT
ncbi:MAG: diadenosine tetraphosphate (Ap4A) HIT family hydrolase [Desulforhopalus sp.]|jgi:diadenosine tetraphosphate (Ap4A) HIT family hydrolase